MHIPVTRDTSQHRRKWNKPLNDFRNPLTPLQTVQHSNDLVGWLLGCSHVWHVCYAPSKCMTTRKGAIMTRKDFVLIAETIKQLPSFDQPADSDVVRFSAIVARFTEALATTNPRFNRARFERACNGKAETK
jgi:hypothetical protein